MKIADIPELIYCPPSGVMLDLDYLEPMLERWKDTYGLDLDPEFQRGHVWTLAIKVKFLEFLFKGGQVPPVRFNSPAFGGHTHSKKSDLDETIFIVDGKQRLTACLEFIQGKIAIFDGKFISDFDDPQLLLRKANMTYIVNRLQTKKELYQWYLEMNEGQIAHTDEELDKVRKLISGV